MIDEHPLPWLAPMLNGVEHANFFETRATEYSKAATRGNWADVWDSFDRRKKLKANDGEDEAPSDEADMFNRRGSRRNNPSSSLGRRPICLCNSGEWI